MSQICILSNLLLSAWDSCKLYF